jgi:hypothetical protein
MKKVILSAGPIPGKLDSVKIITNMFKGGLAVKTAEDLARCDGVQVELVTWRGTEVRFHDPASAQNIPVTRVADIYDYRDYMRQTPADAYVLAAAVANLIPLTPWQGKFPSHHYQVGDEFDIRFTIAPRIIDEIKQHHPRSTLIGYKLFDGSEDALIAAGWETLCKSKANVVFCNHPATAKHTKIAVMPDGTQQRLSFAEHIAFMARVMSLQWYATQVQPEPFDNPWQAEMDALITEIGVRREPYVFGTVAVHDGTGFITTTRGKQGAGTACKVFAVDHQARMVSASHKATLNAPCVERLLARHPDCTWVLHGHRQIADVPTYPYCFSGTLEETHLVDALPPNERVFNVAQHGYYALFATLEDAWRWLRASADR